MCLKRPKQTVWDSGKNSRRIKSATRSNNLKWMLKVTHVALNLCGHLDSILPVGLSVTPRNWGSCSEEQTP